MIIYLYIYIKLIIPMKLLCSLCILYMSSMFLPFFYLLHLSYIYIFPPILVCKPIYLLKKIFEFIQFIFFYLIYIMKKINKKNEDQRKV